MDIEITRLYQFGPFRLDVKQQLLMHQGEPVQLAPKVFETLLLLVERRGQLVGKAEMMNILWPDRHVEESNLTQNIFTLRKLFSKDQGTKYIETIPRRGYRFVAQVSERRAVPIIALLYIMIPAIVVSVIYAYSADFRALTLDATLVIAVTFLGSAIAATLLPWYKPAIFDNSAVAHLKLVVSGAGLITSIILAWTIILWLKDPLYGIGVGNTNSIIFLGVVYGAAALLYVIARLYRRSQGVDLDAIHSEIPAE